MARGDILLSEKHGVNPSIGVCFFCGEDNGEIMLPGRMKGDDDDDIEAPRRAVWHKEPCETCQEGMAKGITLMEMNQEGSEAEPTGRFWVMSEDFIKRVFGPDKLVANILEHRKAFVLADTVARLGLPTEEEGCQSSTSE